MRSVRAFIIPIDHGWARSFRPSVISGVMVTGGMVASLAYLDVQAWSMIDVVISLPDLVLIAMFLYAQALMFMLTLVFVGVSFVGDAVLPLVERGRPVILRR